MPPAIVVENVCKRYRISHETGGRPPYNTLRDELARIAKLPWSWLRGAVRPQMKDFWALKDVNFEVQPGEVIGIIGHNGAGKSTLLKILSRITEPTSGRVRVRGRVGSLLEVGTGFHWELTGRENVFLSGAILGMSRREILRKFDEIVAFADVAQFLDTPVKRYSSGMQMRLAFAVAAHLETEILLIDEVLAVGDGEFQKRVLGKLGEAAHAGRTVLFVSHNTNAVQELCTRAILLKRGEIRTASADVRQVVKEYLMAHDGASGAAEWINVDNGFANPWFQPLGMRLVDETNRSIAGPILNTTKLSLVIEGQVERLDSSMNVGYALYTRSGDLLYWTLFTDEEPSRWPTIEPGRIALRSQIPSRFLNEGDYRLELIASLHVRKWISEPGVSAPSIFFSIQGGLSDSPLWFTQRPGLLAPVMPWERTPLFLPSTEHKDRP